MIEFICCICNEWNSEERSFDINVLYDDNLDYGLPMCRDCLNSGKIILNAKHINYELPKIIEKRGLDKWL